MKYIDADLLKAEVERRITDNTFGAKLELIDILAWLDSLQQEQPESGSSEKPNNLLSEKQEQLEVDLEKEMDNDYDSPLWDGETVSWMTYTRIARHFYEFGLNARKEE